MKEKGVRPIDVSRETGVAYTSLTDWKAGRSKPKVDKMQRLADYFGVPVEYLLTGTLPDTHIDPDMQFIMSTWKILNDDDRNEIMTLLRIKYEKYRVKANVS